MGLRMDDVHQISISYINKGSRGCVPLLPPTLEVKTPPKPFFAVSRFAPTFGVNVRQNGPRVFPAD